MKHILLDDKLWAVEDPIWIVEGGPHPTVNREEIPRLIQKWALESGFTTDDSHSNEEIEEEHENVS